MSDQYPVTEAMAERSYINAEQYDAMYQRSIEDPEAFWSEQADKFLEWQQKWQTVSSANMEAGQIGWFLGGKLNVTINCIDRHLRDRADQTAIIWEGDDPADASHVTFQELADAVGKLANGLRARGVKKGDRVCIYMPMIPEAAYAMLACARIGAIHSVVFSAWRASASHANSRRHSF
jgi:acetyl-CoA synthetase